jgi:hypothetical protein
VGDDLVSNRDLAAHGIDGDVELTGFSKFIEKVGNGGNLVGFLRNTSLRQRQTSGGGISAERVDGFETLALIVGAARCHRSR